MAAGLPQSYSRGVRKSTWLITAGVVLLVSAVAAGPLGVILAGLALFVPYAVGVRLHPRTRHGSCNGTGRHASPFYPWATRRCRGCVGGQQVRHGTRMLGMPHAKSEHRKNTAGIRQRRQTRTWR